MTDCTKCKYFICCDLFKQVFYLQEKEQCDEFTQKTEKVEENKDEENR